MGTKVLGWIVTAVVEHMTKEGISHAEYRIVLIYYTFKLYLKYPLFLSMICNFFFCLALTQSFLSLIFMYSPSSREYLGRNTN